jgi:hypothetical protein
MSEIDEDNLAEDIEDKKISEEELNSLLKDFYLPFFVSKLPKEYEREIQENPGGKPIDKFGNIINSLIKNTKEIFGLKKEEEKEKKINPKGPIISPAPTSTSDKNSNNPNDSSDIKPIQQNNNKDLNKDPKNDPKNKNIKPSSTRVGESSNSQKNSKVDENNNNTNLTPTTGRSTPTTGGSTLPPTGGSTLPPTGGSTNPPTGGSTNPPTGESTTPTGGSTNPQKEEIKKPEPVSTKKFEYTGTGSSSGLTDTSDIDKTGGDTGGGNTEGGNTEEKSVEDEIIKFFGDIREKFDDRSVKVKKDTTQSNKRPPDPPKTPPNKDPDKLQEEIDKAPVLKPEVHRYILRNSNKSSFRKAYSVFNQLVPFIKCYVKTGSASDFRRVEVNLFDIPYNLIKSLEVDYSTGSAAVGTINLKFEDAKGSIGLFLMSKLYSLGLTTGVINELPKILIQFGWAPKGRQKTNRASKIRKTKKIFTSNYFTEYLIEDFELDCGQNFKQNITLKGRQDKTSIDAMLNTTGSNYTPIKKMSQFPLQILRAKEYAFYFHNSLDNLSTPLKRFNKNNDLSKKAVTDFLQSKGYKSTYNKEPGIKLLPLNPIFNCFNSNVESQDNQLFIDEFKSFINNSKFTPIFVLYYVLNLYINTIKEVFKDKNIISDTKEPKTQIRVLELYDDSKIERYGFDGKIEITAETYKELVEKDVIAGKTKTAGVHTGLLNANDFELKETETWGSLLERIATKVKYKNDSTTNLSVSINHFSADYVKKTDLYQNKQFFSDEKEIQILKSSENLKGRLEQLKESYEKSKPKKTKDPLNKKIDDQIAKINKLIKNLGDILKEEDLILIVISAGSKFTVNENIKEATVLQKYTVFPKIRSSYQLKYQNFNSGSKNMDDGYFPDVIDFKPKINFKDVLASHFSNFNVVNYTNGIVQIKSESDIKINESISSSKILESIEEIRKTLESFLTATDKDKKDIEFVSDNGNVVISGKNSIFFKTSLITVRKYSSSNAEDKKIINSVNNRLMEVLSSLRNSTIYSTQNNLFRKAIKVSPGHDYLADYQGYEILANEYMSKLQESAYDFEAELTILGEPAFTFDYGLSLNFLHLDVNNPDGSKNLFLTGKYYIVKMKHVIEGGKFLTTLSLKYSSPKSEQISTDFTKADENKKEEQKK